MSKQNATYTPRLSIELTEEQQKGLQGINLPWGWQRKLFSVLVDEVILLSDTYGAEAIACIAARKINPVEAMQTLSDIQMTGKLLKEDS